MKFVQESSGLQFLLPCWEVPKHVQARISTRHKGHSVAPFDTFNLGDHVGDEPSAVQKNRTLLNAVLPSPPVWLQQVHGTNLWTGPHASIIADGAITDQVGVTLTIMTADCMPMLFCDAVGDVVGICHAGWRGLAHGVIAKTVAGLIQQKRPHSAHQYRSQLRVYLGPTIGPDHFEVGVDVYQAFAQILSPLQMTQCFLPGPGKQKYYANLFLIARLLLQALAIEQIYSEEVCCFHEREIFFSHRRDGISGRFASFLWKTS